MRGLRTIPVLLDVCRDMEELCPDALLLNYVNPMAMLCWAVAEASPIRTVGLCHSVQHTAGELAARPRAAGRRARLPRRRHQPRRVLPAPRARRRGPLPRAARASTPRRTATASATRCCEHFGYFVTESSEHFAEYVPWFIKDGREDLIERFNIPLDEYPRRCERQIAEWDGAARRARATARELGTERSARVRRATSSTRARPASRSRSTATSPTAARGGPADRQPARRLLRRGAVRRLGAAAIEPQPVGALPRQLAALMQTNINVQGLTVEAALTGRREAVYHAAMLDPHTAAELSLDEIARARRRPARGPRRLDPAARAGERLRRYRGALRPRRRDPAPPRAPAPEPLRGTASGPLLPADPPERVARRPLRGAAGSAPSARCGTSCGHGRARGAGPGHPSVVRRP